MACGFEVEEKHRYGRIRRNSLWGGNCVRRPNFVDAMANHFACRNRNRSCSADQTAEKDKANMVIQRQQSVAREIFFRREQFRLAAIRKLAGDLRAYREANGFSIADLSNRTGVSCSVISRAERGIAVSIRNRHKINKIISPFA